MPRILEFKSVGEEVWVRLEKPKEPTGSFYIWTNEEAKRDRASAIRSFCFDLANQYIEREHIESKDTD